MTWPITVALGATKAALEASGVDQIKDEEDIGHKVLKKT
jgi:hypothetical protein